MSRVYYLVCLFLSFTIQIYTQDDTTKIIVDDLYENILGEQDEETENEDLTDVIEFLIQNPVDINSADVFELTRLPFMDEQTALKIINHRNKFGKYFSSSELFSVRNIDQQIIKKILPMVKVSLNWEENYSTDSIPRGYAINIFKSLKLKIRNRVTTDLQNRNGFTSRKFEGSKIKSYNRLITTIYDNYQLGFLIEKDPGERSLADFVSFHIKVSDYFFLRNFIAGDYVLEFGQGLVLWSPFGLPKGTDAISPPKKRMRILKLYTSSAEFRFFRGIASSIQLGNFLLTGFYSNKFLDASVDTLTNEIVSISQTGFHRSASELKKKNSVNEKITGGVIGYKHSNSLNAGIIYYRTAYSKAFQKSHLDNLYGDMFNYLSIYFDFNFERINIFGETSYDGISVASVGGLQIFAARDITFITSARNYPRNYRNLFGSGFGESTGKTNNEFGLYQGVKWKTNIGKLNLYYDIFKNSGSKSSGFFPAQGSEFLLDFLTSRISDLEFRLRYKYQLKEIKSPLENRNKIVNRLTQSLRSELIYQPTRNIRLKMRLENKYFLIKQTGIKENGMLIFQDIRIKSKNNIQIVGRIIFFKTDSFNSAVYEFESDLPGVMPTLPMYGKGIRWYIVAKYSPLTLFNVSIKYSETYKPDETTLSSGDNQIKGNLDNRFSLQFDFSF